MTKITLPEIGKKPRKRRKPMSPENRAAKAALLKALWQDPEFRAKQSAGATNSNKKQWADPEYKAKHVARLNALKIMRTARSRLANAKRFEDPANRERMAVMARKMRADGILNSWMSHTPAGLAKRAQHMRQRHDRQRGFKIPRHLRKEYDMLVHTKKIRAREAGRMLGLV